MTEQEQTLGERIAKKVLFKENFPESEWCYMDINIKQKYIEKADSILSLILAEVDKSGLTPEQIDKLDYLKNTPEFMTSRQVDVWIKKVVAAAQLEAIKKQLRG